MNRTELRNAFNAFLAANIKPGDIVYNWGGNPMRVKRANRKTVTTETGTNWNWAEITPTPEVVQAFKDSLKVSA